jgi:hypothetical protein
MTILVTQGRKSSLGGLHQKDAVQRGFCSRPEENHENLAGVGRSQDTLIAILQSGVLTHEPKGQCHCAVVLFVKTCRCVLQRF